MATSATALALPLLSEVAAAAGSDREAPTPARRLNFLFITADDMDASMPGFMGNRANITPNLDKLAQTSHRFVSTRSAVPICQPSREAMMTGMIPHRTGGIGFTPINGDVPTFTTILQDHGYFTAGIHKIQHMQPPGRFPWDFLRSGKDGNPLTWDDRNPVLIADHVEEAIAAARAQGKPFFINCNITDPHRPFYGSPEAIKQDNGQTGPYKIPREIGPEEVTVPPFLEDLPEVRVELAQYYNSVQRMDIAVGNILEKLSKSPEAANTLILFSSDHGMPFPFAKSTCLDSGTHTPVLIAWPEMGKAKSFDALTSNLDILPTVLDVLGIDTPDGVDGKSWLPIINGRTDSIRDYNFTYVATMYDGTNYPMRAIQDHRYLMMFSPWSDGNFSRGVIDSMHGLTFDAMVAAARDNPALSNRIKEYTHGVPLALYDLEQDAGQRINIIERQDMQVRVNEMKQGLLKHMRETKDPQLKNFELFLTGKAPVVAQRPKRYQHYDWIERRVH
ncbi:heparan N-sulfatase [Novosphingobium endophyticum]|uniref:Heparan N-sulfatase n=1 Tax=Novosphingobium endophyticum TaxID=1955250 RepID=A0A916TWP0_9SPHN|nr:sulfatase [Novosphingobium endophyticum]GGC16480.1 heparan N-sulfatase [Novosphingobium endophyticum]